ncbi:MAG TPA: metal-dependent hydrolase, partial [Dermatophilaceae bacterium]
PWQAQAIGVALLVACAVKALGVPIVGGRVGALVVGVGVALYAPTLSPTVVLIGVLAHLAGDALTDKGIRPLYPLTKDHFTFGIAGTTGEWREQAIAAGLAVSIVVMALGLQGRIPGL